ncbi:hypothetical protein EC991_010336 [Linnemannia zychae]|nr:hypothetical protein EC991_010336 [Linnemannia zychae]
MDPSLLGLHKATERSFSQEDTEHPDSKEKTERGRNEAITRDAHSRADKSALATKKQDQGQRQLRLFFDLRFTPEDNSGTINLVVFFMAYLIMDLTLGFLYYREQVTLLAGWLHHIVYIGITYYAVTRGETYSYALYMPMEAPTIVVGIGCLSKSLRRDMLYGITFIFFRIIFAYSITHEIIWNREREVSITLKSILIFKSLMHLKFLQGWISQQKRLARKRRAEAAAKASEASMLTDPQTKGTEVGSKIVSITAPTIKMGSTVSRKSVHVLREQQQPPVLREDLVAVSTSVESTSRSTVTRSKKARGDELIDVQPVVDMVAVH